MAKRKIKNTNPCPGFELVPNTAGKILDSIWHDTINEVLMIRFATGEVLYHKPLEQESKIIQEYESKD